MVSSFQMVSSIQIKFINAKIVASGFREQFRIRTISFQKLRDVFRDFETFQ